MENKKLLKMLLDHLNPLLPEVTVLLSFPLDGKKFPLLFKPV